MKKERNRGDDIWPLFRLGVDKITAAVDIMALGGNFLSIDKLEKFGEQFFFFLDQVGYIYFTNSSTCL